MPFVYVFVYLNEGAKIPRKRQKKKLISAIQRKYGPFERTTYCHLDAAYSFDAHRTY
jgi:hypothetical protein